MNTEQLEKLKEYLSDENNAKALLALETTAEVQKKLAENGIDISEADIERIKALAAKREDGELSEEDLENVAGGMVDEILELITSFFNLVTEISRSRW